MGEIGNVNRGFDGRRSRGHDNDPVGQKNRLRQAVRHEHDGLVGGGKQYRQLFTEIGPRLFVERGKRFVHQQDAGLETQRARQRRPLFHSA